MLSLENLKKIEQMPTEGEISLQIIAKFYEKYISNRIYELDMENGETLKFSVENTHLPHLIGLHKFYDKYKHSNFRLNSRRQLSKEKGFNNLKHGYITLADLKVAGGNNRKYKQYKKRILNFAFAYQLLRKSLFVSYNKKLVKSNTKINGNYIFVNDVDDNKLHFFFINDRLYNDIYKNEKAVPITFVVTQKKEFIFVSEQIKLRINRIVIKDIKTMKKLEEYNFIEDDSDNKRNI